MKRMLPACLLAVLCTGAHAPAQEAPAEGIAPRELLPAGARDFLLDGPVIQKVGRRSKDLLVEDLNGDGLLDVSTTNNEKSILQLFLQKEKAKPGETRFESVDVTLDRGVRSVVALDANGDGRTDLLLAAPPRPLAVLYQDGKGRLDSPRELGVEADVLVAGDVNGDGFTDVLAIKEKKFQLLPGSRKGLAAEPTQTFQTTGEAATTPFLVDLDGDGRQDVVYHDSQRFQDVVVRLQSPEGTFPAEFRLTSSLMRSVAPLPAAAGMPPGLLAVSQATRQLAYLALSEPDAAAKDQPLPTSPLFLIGFDPQARPRNADLLVADANGDGRSDLVITSPELTSLRVLTQTRTGSLSEELLPTLQGIQGALALPSQRGTAAPLLLFSPEERAVGYTRYAAESRTFPFPRILPIGGAVVGLATLRIGKEQHVVALSKEDSERSLNAFPITEDGTLGKGRTLLAPADATTFSKQDVLGLEPIDANRDGMMDLVVFVDFKPARLLLQQADGTMKPLAATSGVLEGLLAGARPGLIRTLPGADGRVSALAIKEKFARAFTIDKDQNVVVEEQFNGRSSQSRLVAAAAGNLRGDGGAPEVVLLDRGNKCITVYATSDGKEAGYELLTNIPLDDATYTAVEVFDLDGDGRDDIVLAAEDRLAVIFTRPVVGGLKTIATAAPTQEEGGFGEAHTLDVLPNNPGLEVLAVEMRDNLLEFFVPGRNEEKNPALHRFYRFCVFDSESSISRRPNLDAPPEPREMVAADFDGDGLPEVVTLTHDNLIIYTGAEKKKAEEPKKK